MTRSRPSSSLPTPWLGRTALLTVGTLLCLAVTPASAQTWRTTDLAPEAGIPLQFVVSLAIYVVLGGIVLAVAPEYTERMAARIREDAATSFISGLVALIVTFLAAVLLAITVVGILVLIPGAIVLSVVQVVGNTAALVALGSVTSETGRDSAFAALVIGAVLLSVLTLVPILGGIVRFVVQTIGFGAIAGSYWKSRQGRKRSDRPTTA
ncbi:hypothetical protein [Salinirubrum litoreum]|uniref:DUF8173 domain-containing protein n=1 Tax=Salinirubrum litoreum TaxID=1126234 RepID=A0ABD5R859_9EURY|nr:hypothetical protein [Salinirubrum litoreum]